MICSLNEIGATMGKACVGAGFPIGLARTAAAAGVWLCAREFDGVGAVLAATSAGYEAGPVISVEDGHASAATGSVARCGPSLLDVIVSGDATRATINAPDSPLLLVGLAGIAGGAHDVGFSLRAGSAEAHVTASSADNAAALTGVDRVDIRPADASSSPFAVPRGVAVDAAAWDALQTLAHRTYVPATDASRLSGAGASLTDND